MTSENKPYGTEDATYIAAGAEEGIQKLVNCFYDIMASDPAYATIHSWHPDDLNISRDKLARFLCGWMGGPKRYSEKYGKISIPGSHAHLAVTGSERDQWLTCMKQALAKQPYPEEFQQYLLQQLSVPAERIRQFREQQNPSSQ